MVLEEVVVPASPTAKLMQAPAYDLHILAVVGFTTAIDVDVFKKGLERTAAKHPRFSSLLVADDKSGRTMSWRPTKVDVNNHVFKHILDSSEHPTTSESKSTDQIVEDYTSALSCTRMDFDKPLWEAHVLNFKTSDASSTVIFRFHHSLGDGVSLISLLLAAARKTDDPLSLPVVSAKKSPAGAEEGGVWWITTRVFSFFCWVLMVLFYTMADCAFFFATLVWVKDSETLIKGETKVELSGKRFVHRVASLEDVKTIKNATNVAVNDVLLGVADDGLTHYLNMRYAAAEKQGEKKHNALPKNLFLRSAVVFNLRPSATIEDLAAMMEKGRVTYENWGNSVGIVLLPFTMSLHDDPLAYIRRAKTVMNRKKLSLGPIISSLTMKLMIRLFGPEITASWTSRLFRHTTLTFSSVIGPKDEVSLFGHPVSYIAPSVYGFPQALIIHYQSYADKMIISVGADEKLIPNPHQLCDELVRSIERVKAAVTKIETSVKDGIEMC